MKINLYKKPRVFYIKEGNVTISDLGKIILEPNELVSFQTSLGHECDFVAKKWGFYPTSSVNKRLKKEGFKTALVRGEDNKIQINVVEKDKINLFKNYIQSHKDSKKILCWLDELTETQMDKIEKIVGKKGDEF